MISRVKTTAFVFISICIGSLFSVIAIELFLRLRFGRSMDLQMEMFKYAKYLKVGTGGVLPGHRHRPYSKRHLMGVDVHIDKEGNRRTLNPARGDLNSSVFDIVLVGDSFTMGWGVDESHTFSSLISKYANAVAANCDPGYYFNVTNMGVGNYNSMQSYALLSSKRRKISANLLVLVHFVNDAESYKFSSAGFWERESYFYNFISSRLSRKNTLPYHHYYSSLYDQPDWSGNKQALLKLRQLAKELTGRDLIVFLLPELREISRDNKLKNAYKAREEFFRFNQFEYFNTMGILRDASGGYPESLWVSPADSHSNKKANIALSRFMFDKIMPEVLPSKCLAKAENLDPLICPHCGGQMRFLAVIEEPPVIERILDQIGEWCPSPPPRAPPAEQEWPKGCQIPLSYHRVPDIA